MRKLAWLLALLLVLAIPAAAYEVPRDFTGRTAADVVEDFMAAKGLNEDNFSLCYYNTVTGEDYAFNDTWFSIAASTYKLPLNMYFYEMQNAGELTGDTIITWTGLTLDEIHRRSIVDSNNEYSEALMYYWGDHETYKQNMRRYFTMTDAEIDPGYWQGNWFCTRMMMDCLKYLYANRDSFQELIGYMKEALPGEFFKAGVTEYEVAHKYGSVQWFRNDVGIIYTPQPFLLAVYTTLDEPAEAMLGEAAQLLTAYTVWQGNQTPEPEPEPEAPIVQELEVLPVEDPVPEPEEAPAEPPSPKPVYTPEATNDYVFTAVPDGKGDNGLDFLWLLLPVLAVTLLLSLLRRRKRKK